MKIKSKASKSRMTQRKRLFCQYLWAHMPRVDGVPDFKRAPIGAAAKHAGYANSQYGYAIMATDESGSLLDASVRRYLVKLAQEAGHIERMKPHTHGPDADKAFTLAKLEGIRDGDYSPTHKVSAARVLERYARRQPKDTRSKSAKEVLNALNSLLPGYEHAQFETEEDAKRYVDESNALLQRHLDAMGQN